MGEDLPKAAQQKLILALDFASADQAYDFATGLGFKHIVFKIGLELLYAGGQDLIKSLAEKGYSVFVDAKLLDIPNTVERTAAQIAKLGADYLTVHVHDTETAKAAKRGTEGSALKLLGVTVLTSLSPEAVKAQGAALSLKALALLRAVFAQDGGFYGVIASPHELEAMKNRFGDGLQLFTPGIRLSSATVEGDDQARTATPFDAIKAGADAIVVGRPILRAQDPKAAARGIIGEIARALAS